MSQIPRLRALRTSMRKSLPAIGSSHVAEGVARALGFGSNAALLAKVGEGPEPEWRLDGPCLVDALARLGHPGVSPYDVSSALPIEASWRTRDGHGGLWSHGARDAFAAFAATHQAAMSGVMACVLPDPFEAITGGDMAWVRAGRTEAWDQVAYDPTPCLTLPWPGDVGAHMPDAGALRFASVAGLSNVIWRTVPGAMPVLLVWAYGHHVLMGQDADLDRVLMPRVEAARGRYTHFACEVDTHPRGVMRLRVQITPLRDGGHSACLRLVPRSPQIDPTIPSNPAPDEHTRPTE